MKNILISLTILASFQGFAQTNNALTLSGTSEMVTIGAPINSGSSYTKEAWINPSFASNSHNIISSLNAPFWIANNKLQAGHAGTYSAVVDPNTLPLNTWTHVAVTFDAGSGTMKLYRNGVVVNSANFPYTYSSEITYIGSHQGTGSYFQGRLDEIRIWNRALSQEEIRKNIFKSPAVNAAGLVQYFQCNQSYTGQLLNSVPASSSGTCSGGSFAGSSIQFSPNALYFDGSNDYVEIAANPSFDVALATMECWVKPASSINSNMTIASLRGAGTTRFSLHMNTNTSTIGIWNGVDYRTVSYSFTVGQWYHIAYVIKASSTDIYVNGNFAGTATAGMGTVTNLPLKIGVSENFEYFHGVIDEIRFWNHNRSAVQIQSLMNKELDPANASEVNGLIAYYTFDQGIADGSNLQMTTALDNAGSNHGTIYNFALSGTTSNFVTQNPAMSALALKILSFDVRKVEENIRLNWTIDLPQNGHYFIQHSNNGQTWKTIGDLASSVLLTAYSFTDNSPSEGNNYYRIEHVDADGKLSYSDTRLVKVGAYTNEFEVIQVRNRLVSLKVNNSLSVSVFNANGNVVSRKRYAEGIHTLDLTSLPAGVYIIHSGTQSEKVLIK